MSSPSDTDSEPSILPHRAQPILQVGQNAQDTRIQRSSSNTNPYLTVDEQPWISRDQLGHGAASSSSLSLSRNLPPLHVEPGRHGSTPFAMSSTSAEARRQNMIAMDRKRRLTGSSQDNGARRRNASSGFGEREDVFYNRSPESYPSSSRSTGAHSRHRHANNSGTEVIDLTSSPPQPPPVPAPTLTRRSSASTSGGYVVPRWQPDSETAECPICKRPFSFLFRRHHCRKCGRVVCNDCSPHRITIPRQYIVNPPGPVVQTSHTGRDTVDLTGDDDEDDNFTRPISTSSSRQSRQVQNPAIGGGEKVRLCNPCVPDPQPELQPNYTSPILPPILAPNRREDLLTLSDALRSSRHDFPSNNNLEQFSAFMPQHPLPYAAQTSRFRPLPLPPPSRGEGELGGPLSNTFSYPSNDRYRSRGNMSFDSPHIMQHRHHGSESSRVQPQPTNRPRIRSMLDDSYVPRMFSSHVPPSRPRLNEEDICPICRRALPPKGPGGDETARETHIMECINARDPAHQSSSHRSTGIGATQSPPRGPMHMLPFVATEKDCVGDDGNSPECSICMVEYDVGDELARLECLCKFHRECISAWFTRKQECPVHKIS